MKKNDAMKEFCVSKPPSARLFVDEAFDNLRQSAQEGEANAVEFVDGKLRLIRNE